MSRYVDPTEQLVTEIVVKDIRRSVDFYRRLGFELLRDGGDFVELTWEDHRLFLRRTLRVSRRPGAPFPIANVRVIGSWQTKSAHTSSFQLPIAITVYGILPSLIRTTSGSGLEACCKGGESQGHHFPKFCAATLLLLCQNYTTLCARIGKIDRLKPPLNA